MGLAADRHGIARGVDRDGVLLALLGNVGAGRIECVGDGGNQQRRVLGHSNVDSRCIIANRLNVRQSIGRLQRVGSIRHKRAANSRVDRNRRARQIGAVSDEDVVGLKRRVGIGRPQVNLRGNSIPGLVVHVLEACISTAVTIISRGVAFKQLVVEVKLRIINVSNGRRRPLRVKVQRSIPGVDGAGSIGSAVSVGLGVPAVKGVSCTGGRRTAQRERNILGLRIRRGHSRNRITARVIEVVDRIGRSRRGDGDGGSDRITTKIVATSVITII